MGNQGPILDMHNLAWAPFADGDSVEIYDRHNGVPTLGVVTNADGATLFWQCTDLGEASVWVYLRLDEADRRILDEDEDGTLEGLILGLDVERFATLGIAGPNNRLLFEREWHVPPGLTPENAFDAIIRFAIDVLSVALEGDLPPSRRDIAQHASDSARQLVSC